MSLRKQWPLAIVLASATGFAMACAQQPAGVNQINISTDVIRHGVKRFGINLSGQNFYDSGQLLRNLIQRNPGFEGQTWESILRCKRFTRTGCTDGNPYTVWPSGFLDGGAFEVLTGAATGARGVISSSRAAKDPIGYSVSFGSLSALPKNDDFLLVRTERSGGAEAGWWTNYSCGAKSDTELRDLSPKSAGRQALRVEASAPCQRAEITSYFDTMEGHSFVRLKGSYTLRFRAKPLAGARAIHLRVERLDTKNGLLNFLDRSLTLQAGWQDYSIPVTANDRAVSTGNVGVTFVVEGATVLLDDVSFTPKETPTNPTAFRDAVVDTLRDLHPGILRHMDNGANFGTSLDDWIAPVTSRRRTGSSTQGTSQDDIAIGLVEFLELCEAVGAEPWLSLPPGLSAAEAHNVIEFLSGDPGTAYGGKRVALGHAKPWTDTFPQMHLELGNEQWNSQSFAGSTIHDPTAYGQRAAALFRAMRATPSFRNERYDLVAGSWFGVPWWTEQELKALGGAEDSVAVAPYLFSEYNSAPGMEGVFGPMFAQAEQLDSTPAGTMVQQRDTVRTFAQGKRLSIYEVNLGTATGAATVSQAAIDRTVPSVGGGIAVAEHMLLMLRDLGITDQCFFALPEFRNGFTSPGNAGPDRTTPLWGAVVDMGGLANRRRPTFLALQMLNAAMMPEMLRTNITGANPTWHQALSPNDKIELAAAHALQTFAFADGDRRSLIVFNLSRTDAVPVTFRGASAPRGTVETTVLTSAHIEDNNELEEQVKPAKVTQQNFNAAEPRRLPPFSLTVFRWTAR